MQQLGILTCEVASMDTDTKSCHLSSTVTTRPMLVIFLRLQDDSSNIIHKHGAAKDTIGHQEGMRVASKTMTC